VRLRISARASSLEAAQQLIEPVEYQLRQIAGPDCYGADQDTLATVVGKLLMATQTTLAIAESCTGGYLGEQITSVSGSSAYFMGGVIAYDNAVKVTLLGVNPQTIADHGAVSAPVAEQMAIGIRNRLETTWGLSITGIAGPGGGSATKPVGLVYIGFAGPKRAESFEFQFGSHRDRAWIRHLSAGYALDQLRRQLQVLSKD
jgi:nicotinamide-nucleotide amidase